MAEEGKKKKKQSIGASSQENDALIIPRNLSISEQNSYRAYVDSVHTSRKMERFLDKQEKNRKTKKKRRGESDKVLADLKAFAETGSGKTFNRTPTEEAVARKLAK